MTRAVIWAGVSSRPQVEDKDSLPRQIAEGDKADANRWLRGVLARIWIDNRQVTRVEL